MARAAWISRAVRRKSLWIIFEGIEPDDVTGRFYSADPAINRRCEIMEKWSHGLSTGVPKQSAKTVS
jgi:hypothetical protein